MKGRAPDAGPGRGAGIPDQPQQLWRGHGGASGPPSTLCRSRAPTTCMAAPLASSVTVCWMRAIRSPSVRRWRQTDLFEFQHRFGGHSDQEFARPAAVWRRHRLSGHEKQDLPIYFFEGLRQNSQNSVPVLTDSSIFAGPSIAGNTCLAISSERPEAGAATSDSAAVCLGQNVRCLA